MSEELTKNQKNLVNVLNYCLETKHDFDGNRSNKLTRLFARQVLNCMSLPKILSNEQESNFQDDILTDFGLDIDSVQRDSYMETEMVLGVFLNPKTYHPNVDIKENLEIWAYKHDIKYSDTGIDDDASGTMPETLYKCNLMMGELELDKEEKLEANEIYEHVMNFIQDRKIRLR